MLLQITGSERLSRKAFLLKSRKVSKDQKEILACALQNGCLKFISKAQGKCPCCNLVSETSHWDYIKMRLHVWHCFRNISTFFSYKMFLKTPFNNWLCKGLYIYLESQKNFASSGLHMHICRRVIGGLI